MAFQVDTFQNDVFQFESSIKIKFNPTGTSINAGKLQIRLDLYPAIDSKTYSQHHIGEQFNPFLCIFISGIDPNMTAAQLLTYITDSYSRAVLNELDDILYEDRKDELYPTLENKLSDGYTGEVIESDITKINNTLLNLEVNK